LKEAIALRLRSENVMLLHDCVDVRFEDDTLIKYYTEWLPGLLEGQAHNGRLKCVQPIEWHEEAGLGFIQRLLSGRRVLDWQSAEWKTRARMPRRSPCAECHSTRRPPGCI
jgi:hypothetical protein